MLQLGTTSWLVDGVEVFPDHADPNQFWYLPAPVTLAQGDQGPVFTLITWRGTPGDGDSVGGGFLMIQTALTLDPEAESRLRSRLAEHAPGTVRLSQVPYDEGDVQCVALDVQGPGGTVNTLPPGAFRAVETILGSAVPSLYGDNTAMFSLRLSAQGASLLKQVFAAGGTPVGVIYRLRFTALRPALSVTITANMHRVYSELAVGIDAQIYWARVGLEAAFQRLRQSGVIHIDVKEFTTDADNDQKIQWALDTFMNHVLAQWFEPSLSPRDLPSPAPRPATAGPAGAPAGPVAGTPTPGLGPAAGRAMPLSPTGAIPPRTGPFAPPVAGPVTPPGAGPVTPATPGAPGAVHPPGAPAQPAGPAPAVPQPLGPPLAPSPPAPPAIPTPHFPPAPAAPPQAAAASPAAAPHAPAPSALPAGAAPAATGGVSPALVTFRLRYGLQIEDKEVSFSYDRAEAVQRTYAPQGFLGTLAADLNGPPHVIDADLDDPFFRTLTVQLVGDVDFAALGLTSIAVTIRYGRAEDPGGVRSFDRLVDAAAPRPEPVTFFRDSAADTTYAYRLEYHFAAESGWRGRELTVVREGSDDQYALSIDPHRFLGFLRVEIAPHDIDAQLVRETRVELTRKEPDGTELRDTRTVRPTDPPTEWKVRTADPADLTYTYQLVHTMTDGSVITCDPVTTGATHLAVNDPYPGQLDIDLVPDWTPAAIRTVFVDLRYADPAAGYRREQRIELDAALTATHHAWFALPDPQKREFSYRFTFVRADGTTSATDYTTTTDSLVMVRPP
ncbi:hypothetical protein GCM10010260_50910 [Streptomyces filipinensis]|uniref:Uncharacterized protein n=1 Tax=Streptomyces filipinensis TaxID=66887 RepID=A0A918IE98_9ACTN|nr:hypothetical protein [Streptomyces filipinensis]GGV07078.1 hypothetical protein GCM10010260_50910 [Streptomyces filipinensis]